MARRLATCHQPWEASFPCVLRVLSFSLLVLINHTVCSMFTPDNSHWGTYDPLMMCCIFVTTFRRGWESRGNLPVRDCASASFRYCRKAEQATVMLWVSRDVQNLQHHKRLVTDILYRAQLIYIYIYISYYQIWFLRQPFAHHCTKRNLMEISEFTN